MKKYLANVHQNTTQTPQSQPISGKAMDRNAAGGYTFSLNQWQQLERFLILGSEGGTYYASEAALTIENAKNVLACIQEDGVKVVETIVKISDSGRAAKNEPAIFALAMAASQGDETTRGLAFSALSQVCRTGTHLFSFVEYIQALRGWGRALRRGVGAWYQGMEARQLAYQVVKYRQRNGWTHTDTLRKAHPNPRNKVQGELFKWITRPTEVAWKDAESVPDDEAQAFIWAFERVQQAPEVATVVKLIADYDLPREALPTQWLNTPEVWDALLPKMPMTAMIRNLGNMSKVGLLVAHSAAENTIVKRLTDEKALAKARIHPLNVLSALRVYAAGHGYRGKNDWTVSSRVVDALESAFELSFKTVTPTNKRTMLALDISGSMGMGMIAGVAGLTPREASAAMAMVTARTEPNHSFMGFGHNFIKLDISAKMRLDDVVNRISGLSFGGTDCALPMLYALEKKLDVDTFVVYTDNETWYGGIHPVQALSKYREKTGIPAKLIVVGMTATKFSIADPNDAGMLDVVGFDSAAPTIMADFARGML